MDDAGAPPLAPAAIVLDTNAALDWLVFGDPATAALAGVIECGAVRWTATERMRAEFAGVARRLRLAGREIDCERSLTCFDRWASIAPAPVPRAPPRLRCSDADDQIFVELALDRGARWLLTRDKALLKLARAAAACGLLITTPTAWRYTPR